MYKFKSSYYNRVLHGYSLIKKISICVCLFTATTLGVFAAKNHSKNIEPIRTIAGKVIRVADGDTITVLDAQNLQNKIRLYGIDAPEKAQDFGNKSREKLASLVAGKDIAVTVMDIDRYGSNVGRINIEGKEVAEEMLKAGMVWLYTAYCKIPECKHWKELETQAKTAKIGLWSNPTAKEPWLWRREHK